LPFEVRMGINRSSKSPRVLAIGRISDVVGKDASCASVLQHSAIFSSRVIFRPPECPDRLALCFLCADHYVLGCIKTGVAKHGTLCYLARCLTRQFTPARFTRRGGQRPKGAKVRNRRKVEPGGAASLYEDLIVARGLKAVSEVVGLDSDPNFSVMA
jgi:hypothetical protein